MRRLNIFCFLFCFLFCFYFCESQIIEKPIYKELESIGKKILNTDDINLFPYNSIQYIGDFKNEISVNTNNFIGFNPQIQEFYSNERKDSKGFFYKDFENIVLNVDVTQKTPLKLTEIKATNSEIDQYLSENREKEIPKIDSFYDAFPLTIYNQNNEQEVVGYGNTIPLELEAQNKNGEWKSVYEWRKYPCSAGIKPIILKPRQILTVFVPKYSGDFETKLRYRFNNITSNEFIGKINESYISE